MDIIKRNTNNKSWWGHEEKGSVLCYWWLSKLVQSLWKTVWRFLKKLKVEILCVLSCSVICNSATPWTVARQDPLSMRLSWHEYWSGLPFPPPGDLSDTWTEPISPALAGGFITTEPPGRPRHFVWPNNSTLGYVSERNINLKRLMNPMFIAALFITAKVRKHPKCPSIDEMYKNVNIYNEYCCCYC